MTIDPLGEDTAEDLDAETPKLRGLNIEGGDYCVPRSLTSLTIVIYPTSWDNGPSRPVDLEGKLEIIRRRCRDLKLDIRRDEFPASLSQFTSLDD